MRITRALSTGGLCLVLTCASWAQDEPAPAPNGVAPHRAKTASNEKSRTATVDDGLSIISAALDAKSHLRAEKDCSHLVHSIYQRAGFSYEYVSSSDLYAGDESFRRVSHPQPGDLVVWQGHAGIVINPSRRTFFSYLTSGPGVDDWGSTVWKSRGNARFYRYVKNPVVRDLTSSSRRSRQLVRVSK
jgi:NlpC/P60 family